MWISLNTVCSLTLLLLQSTHIAETYELSFPVSHIRTKLRQEFERHRYVEELPVKNMLYAKGQMEFQETINYWKQQPHVLKFFQDEEAVKGRPKPTSFVEKFLQVSIFQSVVAFTFDIFAY